jgi:hypothetical protein
LKEKEEAAASSVQRCGPYCWAIVARAIETKGA